MSHYEQQEFVKLAIDHIKKVNNNFFNFNVLDVGSYDVGGSVKYLFLNTKKYLGIDLVEGPNVDLVLNGDELYKLNQKFDIIISCECFEHAKNWKSIFQQMSDQTSDNGYVIFTCASRGRVEHGTSRTINSDSPGTDEIYYKNIFKSDIKKNFNLEKIFKDYFLFYNIKSSDLYFIGLKSNSNKLNFQELKKDVKNIKNLDRKIKIIRIILSYLLNDKNYQNLTFLRRNFKNKIKNFFRNWRS